MPPTPSIISAHVAGSGAAAVVPTVKPYQFS